jgi:hypothetical protein
MEETKREKEKEEKERKNKKYFRMKGEERGNFLGHEMTRGSKTKNGEMKKE